MGNRFFEHVHDCFQVCFVVSEVTNIDDYVFNDASYSRENSKGLINFLLKDALGIYHTGGMP